MSKEQTALERTAVEEYASKIAQSILDYHKDKPVKELTDLASQAVEDYKQKLKAVFLEEPNGTVNLGRFLKLIDSIK